MKKLVAISLTCLSSFVVCTACTCVIPDNFDAHYRQFSLVFEGQVLSVAPDANHWGNIFTIRKIKSYRGESADTVKVYSDFANGGLCGFKFQLNETYLLFCYNRGWHPVNTGELETDRCLYNTLVSDTQWYNEVKKKIEATTDSALLKKVAMITGTWQMDSSSAAGFSAQLDTGELLPPVICPHFLPAGRIQFRDDFTGIAYHFKEDCAEDSCFFNYTFSGDTALYLEQTFPYYNSFSCRYSNPGENSFSIILASFWKEKYPPAEVKFNRVRDY